MPIPKRPDVPALTGLDSNNIELNVQLVTPMFVDKEVCINPTDNKNHTEFLYIAVQF
jgi:hypothetical protein